MNVATSVEYDVCDPAADGRGFRNALGQFGTGVAVVTARSGAALTGMTINSFAAVSLDPPLVLWSIRRQSKRADAFVTAESFAVNILAESQSDLARAFASDKPGSDPFESARWVEGHGGSPLLEGTLARFECRRHEVHTAGDHQIILGAVERCSVLAGTPLLFVQGEFVTRQSLTADDADGGAADDPDATGDGLFARVVTAASYGLSHRFDAYRARLGVSVAEGRILERLSRRPMTIEELGRSAYLGTRAVEDTVAQLRDAGLVTDAGSTVELTGRGDELRRELAASAQEFHRAVLAGIPDQDLRVARRVLTALAGPQA